MDKVVRKTTLKMEPNDFKYWQSKSFAERLAALEFLRQQAYGKDATEQRLQRVCRIVKRARR